MMRGLVIVDGKRECSACGEFKPHDAEHFQPIKCRGVHKLSLMCRSCRNASTQRWRYNNKSKVSSYTKLYYDINKDEIAAKMKEWRVENSNLIRNYNREYYTNNKEEILSHHARYRADHADRVAESCARWTRNNPDKNAAKTAKRRAAEKRATPIGADMKAIEAFYVRAREMTLTTGICHHVDHIVPLALGGTHEPCNLRIIPAAENLRKGARPPIPTDFTGA